MRAHQGRERRAMEPDRGRDTAGLRFKFNESFSLCLALSSCPNAEILLCDPIQLRLDRRKVAVQIS